MLKSNTLWLSNVLVSSSTYAITKEDKICRDFWQSQTNFVNLVHTVPKLPSSSSLFLHFATGTVCFSWPFRFDQQRYLYSGSLDKVPIHKLEGATGTKIWEPYSSCMESHSTSLGKNNGPYLRRSPSSQFSCRTKITKYFGGLLPE